MSQRPPSLSSSRTSASRVLYDVIEEPQFTAVPILHEEQLETGDLLR